MIMTECSLFLNSLNQMSLVHAIDYLAETREQLPLYTELSERNNETKPRNRDRFGGYWEDSRYTFNWFYCRVPWCNWTFPPICQTETKIALFFETPFSARG